MNTIRSSIALATIAGAAAVAACTLTVTSNPLVNPDASTDDSGAGDSATGDASDAADAAVPMGFVRFAHLSSDAPSVDFCLAPHGTTTFTGPMMAALVSASDAGTDPF